MDIRSLSEKFYDYSLYIKGFTPATISRYKQTIKFFCSTAQIEVIEQVTAEKIHEFFYKGRTERHWMTMTYISYHKSLVVFFRWCVKNGYLSENPMNEIETPKPERRIPFKLTKQQSLHLLEVCFNYPYTYKFLRYRNHAILATCIFAGLRKKEVLKLKYADVDTENLTIFINLGKGSKDRIIPMSHTLASILKRYSVERKRLNKTCPQFFTSLSRNMGLSERGIRRMVKLIRDASGLPFSLHKLRHTFATLMLEGGCDIYSLSKMMGHSDIKTTTIYLSASAEHLRMQILKHPLN